LSFRLKTILGIALIESFLLMILVFSAMDFLQNSNEKQLQQRADITLRLFSSAIKDAVLSMDLATLESFVEEIVTNPDIVYTRISNSEIILAQSGDATILNHPHHPDKTLFEVTDGIYDIRTEVMQDGISYAVIEMGLSTESIEHLFTEARRWIGSIASLEISLVALFSFVLGTYLTKQLSMLKKASNKVALEGLGYQIPISGNNEISDVAHAFNDMSNKLIEAQVKQDSERKKASVQIIQASKLATLGEMATSVAHELNQPLNVIRMAAGNSRRKISKGCADLKYLNNKLERIEEQTTRASAIIDHMRMFGREATKDLKPIDLRSIVTSALELMGEQLRLDGIEILIDLPKDCASVLGHGIQMEQVVLNLLTNAKDAMTDSGTEKKITLRVFESDRGLHITIDDTGGGILECVLPRIFEPFYTTKEVGKGTGLGLSVSYGIVREMNGYIVAENIDGGARFTITLLSVR
jgi:C4-dicarboxylate-specific signal transduction histidine kinase